MSWRLLINIWANLAASRSLSLLKMKFDNDGFEKQKPDLKNRNIATFCFPTTAERDHCFHCVPSMDYYCHWKSGEREEPLSLKLLMSYYRKEVLIYCIFVHKICKMHKIQESAACKNRTLIRIDLLFGFGVVLYKDFGRYQFR